MSETTATKYGEQRKVSEPNEISFERLADWVEGRLPEEEARAVEEQVAAAGEETHAEVEWLRAFARASESTVLDSPPAEVRDELMRRFEAYAEGRRPPGLLQRLVATLALDGGLQPAFGVRSAGAEESQGQLVYTSDAADVALSIHRRLGDRLLDLDGQVFPAEGAEPAIFSVQLSSGATGISITTTDELGEFTFEGIPPGTYDILVSNEQVEIQISSIELRL